MTITHLLFAVEILFLTYFFSSFPRMNAGNFAGIFLSAAMMTVTVYFTQLCDLVHRLTQTAGGVALLVIAALILLAGVVYAVVFTVLMLSVLHERCKKADVLVVLGCRIKGTKPTRMLRRRLDTAFEYLKSHPDLPCIVSGGRGADEQISEAQAMSDYLLAKGLDGERIIMEDKSATTYENLKFSARLMRCNGRVCSIIVATDGFHQYRARLIAKQLGLKTYDLSAKTEPRFVLIYWIRELMALGKFFLKRILRSFSVDKSRK